MSANVYRALLLAPYVIVVAALVAGQSRQQAFLDWPGFWPFLALFITVSVIHRRAGVQVEDYVHTGC